MPRVTLTTILEEMKKRDLEADTRFEFMKEQFHRINVQFVGIDTKFEGIDAKFEGLEVKMEKGFSQIHSELKIIRNQTAHLTERVTRLEEAKNTDPTL